jgi:spore coat polysaccharide biosynthesis protein SpsF
MTKTAFIIQARIGSMRLPRKVLLPFWNDKTIMDILIEKLSVFDLPIILATSTKNDNDMLAELAAAKGIALYRGSEKDVLLRFVEAAKTFGIKNIIRICADNPFLDIKEMRKLIDFTSQNPNYDYVSFDINGSPSIKTHLGFWAEYASFKALEKIMSLTNDDIYHEHVTNYIYEHPNLFGIHLLKPNSKVIKRENIRMTLDTAKDFENLSQIYQSLREKYKDFGIDEIIDYLDNNPVYIAEMEKQINENKK